MKARIFLAILGLATAYWIVRAESQPITLATTLRLAGAQNLSLALARERIHEARNLLQQDRQTLFPWVAPGIGYKRHDGNLQDVVGNVFDASKQSGTAALTLQGQLDLGDSIYRILVARQVVRASEASEAGQHRDLLRQAATAYTELSRAAAALLAADESVRIADEFLRQIKEAVDAGIAFAGDAPRAEVQRDHNESLRLRAREEIRLASVRLAQLLRLPLTLELEPTLSEFVPVVLIDSNRALDSLMATALARRPELTQNDALLAAARAKRDGVTQGPWMPTVGAQAALGGLAGGRNGDFHHGDDFQDYSFSLAWRLGPGGLGDRARIRTAESRLRQAELGREQARDEIAREVIVARTRTETATAQLAVASRTLMTARRLLELTQSRREFGVGEVLEAVEAERELTRAQTEHLRAIGDHNRSQWELWNAVGDEEPKETSARPQ